MLTTFLTDSHRSRCRQTSYFYTRISYLIPISSIKGIGICCLIYFFHITLLENNKSNKTNVTADGHQLKVLFRRWKGQCYWGLSYMGTNIHSLQRLDSKGKNSEARSQMTEKTSSEAECSHQFSAVISTSEKDTIKAALSRVCGERIFRAAGAGYKSLCVVQGLVDIYIFSEDTTFKWDSCAAHAILKAMGGGMVDLRECLQRNSEMGLDLPQLVYHMENEGTAGVDRWANKGGLIAYRSRKQLETFLSLLIQNLVDTRM